VKIKAILDIGYYTARQEEIFDVDDNATEKEIEELVTDWANEHIYIDWRKV